jgi:hypothetical protein
MERLLRDQWMALRSWLDEVDVRRHGECASGLPAWTIRELVVHLGFGLVMLDEVVAAPGDAQPLPLGDYIARYRPAASAIATSTRELAEEMPNELECIDSLAARAWAALDRARAPIVMGRRGPLTHDDFLLTRLVELVVHGDDLHRAVPVPTRSPLLPEATSRVARALAEAYERRTGQTAAPGEPEEWLRLATGRRPSSDPHLPVL